MSKMFYIEKDDDPSAIESAPLLDTYPSLYQKPRTWRRYVQFEMKLPRAQAIVGFLLGLFLIGMVLLLIVELIRESPEPDLLSVPRSASNLSGAIPQKPDLLFIQSQNFQDEWTKGEELVANRKNLEEKLFEKGILPQKSTSSYLLQTFLKPNANIQGMQDCAIIVEHVKKTLHGCIDRSLLPAKCRPDAPVRCDPNYPYRSINGSCNNLQQDDWGMSQTPFNRLLRPEYADGVSFPRASKSGDELPNPRFLSNKLYTHKSRPLSNATVLVPYFGLFVDHDIVRIAAGESYKGNAISCCNPEIIDNPTLLHPECMAIKIPDDDRFYSQFDVDCLDFIRSAPAPGECPGEREQVNLASSFLDASTVYGPLENICRSLREYKDGQLAANWINNTELLPTADKISYKCGAPNKQIFCFKAGDARVNEQVDLTAVHIVFMREHNRIAMILRALNPDWDDEKLFQESRRVVIAELQHITYNEFLPLLVGQEVTRNHRLLIDPQEGYDGYDQDMNPSIFNVFAAAAFRVGHTLIQGMIDLINKDHSFVQHIPIHECSLNPRLFYQRGYDSILRGLLIEKAASADSFINEEIRNHLFQPHNKHYGMDLSAIGIQRGRDHGIPSYTKWRKFCNLSEINSWEDLFEVMDSEHVQRLRKAYDSVEDIDLSPGAFSENHIPGALVGPTHACLIARQFEHTRYGDRFWFEERNQVGSFKEGQIKEIYKSSLSRLLCDNSDGLTEIQKLPFMSISDENPLLKCSEFPIVNLRLWKE